MLWTVSVYMLNALWGIKLCGDIGIFLNFTLSILNKVGQEATDKTGFISLNDSGKKSLNYIHKLLLCHVSGYEKDRTRIL